MRTTTQLRSCPHRDQRDCGRPAARGRARCGTRKEAAIDALTVTHPIGDELAALIAERFRVLAEPVRIRLLDRLREGEATVLELTARVGTSQQNVSKHLGVLQRARIVARRKDGNFAYYRIVDDGVFALCETVCGSLLEHADALRRTVGG